MGCPDDMHHGGPLTAGTRIDIMRDRQFGNYSYAVGGSYDKAARRVSPSSATWGDATVLQLAAKRTAYLPSGNPW